MRRYAVRFLVAVLTFAIGVAISLALGLFRVQNTKFEHREWRHSNSCPTRFRVSRPPFITIDSQPNDPLKISYVGTTSKSFVHGRDQLQFMIENRSDKPMSEFLVSARELWGANGEADEKSSDFSSFEVLEPGDSRLITMPSGVTGWSISVTRVNFQDGSIWINPRAAR